MCKKILLGLLIVATAFSCKKGKANSLFRALENDDKPNSPAYIIACAAGMKDGFMGDKDHPVSMFFYPVEGACNYKYYESKKELTDPSNYAKYNKVDVNALDVFNGYLKRFPLEGDHDRWGIVTYEVNDSVRTCNPVHIKVEDKETVWAPESISHQANGVNPMFSWIETPGADNVIHFQVVANANSDLISGTYTKDLHWTFYDLSNVVLNIKETTPEPELMSNSNYQFTLMSVSDDNWVNTFGQIDFTTE